MQLQFERAVGWWATSRKLHPAGNEPSATMQVRTGPTCGWYIVKKEKKNYASSKKLLTSIKEKGPLGTL